MIQIFLVLIGATIGLLYPLGIEADFFDPRLTGLLVPGSCLAYAVLGSLIARTYLARFRSGGGLPVFPSFVRCMILYRVLLLLLFAAQVHVLLWPVFVDYTLRLQHVILVEELVLLSPFVLALFLSWIPLYRLDRELKRSEWSLGAYLRFQSRLIFGPTLSILALVFLLEDTAHAVPWLANLLARHAWLDLILGIASLLVVAAVFPLLLRIAWGGTPLPRGPIRDRLEALCVRAGVRVREMLLLDVRGGRFANALMTGIFAPLRYVFFSRPLLEGLEPIEIDAVLAHEMGHAKHRHLLWYFALTGGLTLFSAGLAEVLGIQNSRAASGGMSFGLLIGCLGFFLTYVSWRFERQADLFSLRIVGAAAPLASALFKVCALNGVPASAASVTHGSALDRAQFLAMAEEDPARGGRFERSLRSVKAFIGAVFAAGVVLLIGNGIREERGSAASAALEEASALIDAGDAYCRAEKWDDAYASYKQATEKLPKHWFPWYWLGRVEEERHHLREARGAYLRSLGCKTPPDDPAYRIDIRGRIESIDSKISSGKEIGTDH